MAVHGTTFCSPFLGKLSRPHFCDEAINIGEFCKSFSDEVTKAMSNSSRKNAPHTVMAVSMDMTEDAVEEVAQICSIDKLTCATEPAPLTADHAQLMPHGKSRVPKPQPDFPGRDGCPFDPEALRKLRSLRAQRRRLAAVGRSSFSSSLLYSCLRYASEIRVKPQESRETARLRRQRTYPMRNFDVSQPVVVVRVYMPSVEKANSVASSFRSTFSLSQEVLCLGTTTLTELRDIITCANDVLVVNDCSIASSKPIIAKDIYPSGFFYIAGAFYADRRDPASIDYSEPIRQWAAERKLGVLPVHSMADQQVRKLTVRLGYPYVYVHQGRCQHMLIFSDIQLFHPNNVAKKKLYPMVHATRRHNTQLCHACERYCAKWITTEHELTPTEPTYFCQACFKTFNYKKHGRPLSKFKAYPLNPAMSMPEI